MPRNYNNTVATLKRVLPYQTLGALGRAVGFIVRLRELSASMFVWAVVLSRFRPGRPGFAEANRCYQELTGKLFAPRPFQLRFRTPQSVRLFERAFERITAPWNDKPELRSRPSHPLATWFSDVVITDSTILQLADELKKPYPGLRKIAAGMKVTLTISLFGLVPLHAQLSPATRHDGQLFPRLKAFSPRTLFLFDLGFLAYRRLEEIARAGSFYLCRHKKSGNAVVVHVRRGPKRLKEALRRHPDGVLLRDLLPKNKRISKAWDVDVLLRPNENRKQLVASRLIIVPGPKQQQRGYLTNLPTTWDATALVECYRLRWQIELVFKELKQHLNLTALPSKNKHAVQVFVWASLIALALSRHVSSCLYAVQTLLGLAASLQPMAVTKAMRSCVSLLAHAIAWPKKRIKDIAQLFIKEIRRIAENDRQARNDSCARIRMLAPAMNAP